jgi:O-antigen/teichoic acid export membrane protein
VCLAFAYQMLSAVGAHAIFSTRQLRVVSRFLAFTSATALGHVLFASLDRVVVGAVLGVSQLAYYSVAIGVAVNLLNVADVLTRPLMPAVSAWAATAERTLIRRVLIRTTLATAALEALAGGVLLAVSGPFMRLWLGSAFAAHALTPFRVLVVIFAVVAVGAPSYQVANGSGHPWAPAAGGTVGGAATIAFIFLLAPRWGVTGAAAANFWAWAALFPLTYMLWKLRGRTASSREPSPAPP